MTQPTPAMREAMANAEVGDDVFGEDPTVRRLEALAAELMGKEAAVFVASGTMGNLTCLLAHCQRGDEAIVGSEAHLLHYEAGGAPGLGAIQLRTVSNDARGMLDVDEVEATIRGQNVHFPRTAVVCLENTHNRCGGGVLTAEETAEIAQVARRHNVAVHLDGARIFNAAVALGVPASELTQHADTVTFCLSKGLAAPVGSLVCGTVDFVARARRMRKMVGGGMRQVGVIAAAGIVALGVPASALTEHADSVTFCLSTGLAAPVGSLVCGTADFVARARRMRKMVGGGMRQVGIIAAAGIVALETMVDRLAEDHEHARLLAQGLDRIPGLRIDPESVQSNIVVFGVNDGATFQSHLREAGVLTTAFGPTRVRMVPHYGITRDDIEEVLERVRRVVASAA